MQTINIKFKIGLEPSSLYTDFKVFSQDQDSVVVQIEVDKELDSVTAFFVGKDLGVERPMIQDDENEFLFTVPFDYRWISQRDIIDVHFYGQKDEKRYDIGSARFYADVSTIDSTIPAAKEYYFEKVEDFLEENFGGDINKIKPYIAGTNITIDENNVISAADKDTTYAAGPNVSISDGIISATDTVYDDAALTQRVVDLEEEPDYIAGDNITIDENKTISAADTIYDDSAILSALTEKVDKDGSKVLSTYDYDLTAKAKVDAIPENPKYTDTDTIYDDTALSTAVSNKLNKSSDILDSYREKYHTLSSGVIDLDNANIFIHALSGDTTYSIINAAAGVAHSFSLIITMGNTLYTVTFPTSVKWHNEDIPDMSEENKQYELLFTTTDGGTTWRASFGGMY